MIAPHLIGRQVIAWTESAEARGIFNPLRWPSGKPLASWTLGGCEIMASALLRVLPGSKLVGLYRAQKSGASRPGIAHYGVLYKGAVFDGEGSHSWFGEWVLSFHGAWPEPRTPDKYPVWRGADPHITHTTKEPTRDPRYLWDTYGFYLAHPTGQDIAEGRIAGVVCDPETVHLVARSLQRSLQAKGLLPRRRQRRRRQRRRRGRAAALGPMMEGFRDLIKPRPDPEVFMEGRYWRLLLHVGEEDEDGDLEFDILQLEVKGKIVSAVAGELGPQIPMFVEHNTFSDPSFRGRGYMRKLYEILLRDGYVVVSDKSNHSAPMLSVWRRLARRWVVMVPARDGIHRLTGKDAKDPLLNWRFVAFPTRDASDVDPEYLVNRTTAAHWYDEEGLVGESERPGSGG